MDDSFRIGDFTVEPQLNRIRCGDRKVQIESKAMEVLVYLSEHPREVLPKERIIQAVWPDVLVTDDVLTHAISELRKAFGDDAKAPRFIQTIPRKGYRLIGQTSVATPTGESRLPKRIGTGPLVAGGTLVFALMVAVIYLITTRATSDTPAEKVWEPVPLTSFPGVEKQPTFSPDGSQVAFVWNGEKRDNIDIYVKTVDATQPVRLTTDPASDFSPAWSPNGRQIAFLRSKGSGNADVFLIPPTGGTERRITELWSNRDVPTLAWSPDGRHLAFPDGRLDEQRGIFLLSLDTGQRTRLTSASGSIEHDRLPVFSPDGETIFFLRNVTGGGDIYAVPVVGGDPRVVSRAFEIAVETTGSRGSSSVAMTPKGDGLVLGRNRLRLITIDDGTPRRLAGIQGHDPAISPQGNLAFAHQERDTNIWKFDLAATGQGAAFRFITSTQGDVNPQFSRDGARIAFSSNRSGEYEVWVCSSDGSNLLQLTTLGDCGSPRWSADGAWITFDSRADVYAVSTSGGSARQITSQGSREFVPSWSSDGRWIYFASDRTGEFQIWKIGFESEAAQDEAAMQVTHDGGFRPIESLDGRHIYYFKGGHTAGTNLIWRLPVGGVEETAVLKSHAAHWANWDVTRDGIYFVDWQEVPNLYWADMPLFATEMKWVVRFLRFEDGSVSQVAEFQHIPFVGPALGVSPDGRWLLSAQFDRDESDLMLVENFR